MDAELRALLREADAYPVLVDIGSSGGSPDIWNGFAAESTYVGFDPDLRETRIINDGRFRRMIIVNRAVVASDSPEGARFYLTRSPHCSSTLQPNIAALQEFLFADLFDVERETTVPATTLDAMLRSLSLDRIDWLKTDSQGIDLRLLLSVPDAQRSKMLAVDMEPGLTDAYEGEDLFPQVHDEMRRSGFWLSNLRVRGSVRMRPGNAPITGSAIGVLKAILRTTPGWVEARYLRAPASLRAHGGGPREFVLLWAFALADDQPGFALDVANEFQRAFPLHELGQRLQVLTVRRLDAALRWAALRQIGMLVKRVLRRVRGNLGG